MTKIRKTDWNMIEREFRAGILSVRQIAKQAGISESAVRKMAKEFGWMRDLTEQIRAEVRGKLVRSENSAHLTAHQDSPTESEIIDVVSNRNTQLILLQREDIKALREHEERLLKELEDKPTKLYITQYKGEVVQKTISMTVAEKASTLGTLTNVREKRISLERELHGIEALQQPNNGPEDKIPAILREMMAKRPVRASE